MSTPPPPPGYNPPPPPGFNDPQYGTPAPPPQPQYGGQPQYGAPPPPGYQPYPPQGFGNQGYGRQYAGVGSRFGAMLLDGLIGILFYAPAIIAFFASPKEYTDCTIDGESGICKVPTAAGWAIIAVLGAIGLIAYLVIYCKKVGAGQSWGHKAVGIRVADKDTDQPIGTGRAVGRYFGRILSGIPCYLGFFWALWDKDKQTWHDKMVRSVVVKT